MAGGLPDASLVRCLHAGLRPVGTSEWVTACGHSSDKALKLTVFGVPLVESELMEAGRPRCGVPRGNAHLLGRRKGVQGARLEVEGNADRMRGAGTLSGRPEAAAVPTGCPEPAAWCVLPAFFV